MDVNGWLYFSHRDEEGGVRRLGEFISTESVMRAIAEFPEVADVYVYGVPDPSGVPGESSLVAAVVPATGCEFDPQAVFNRCNARLAHNARPDLLQVVDELPVTATAKVQARILRELLESQPDHTFSRA